MKWLPDSHRISNVKWKGFVLVLKHDNHRVIIMCLHVVIFLQDQMLLLLLCISHLDFARGNEKYFAIKNILVQIVTWTYRFMGAIYRLKTRIVHN